MEGIESLNEVASSITAAHFVTSLAEVETVEACASPTEADELLAVRGFTAAPVTDGRGLICGVYTSGSGAGIARVSEAMQPLGKRNIVTADAQFEDLLECLSQNYLVLVLQRADILGIVTPSDIWTMASRVYLYARIASAESALAAYLRHRYPDQEAALSFLSQPRRKAQDKLKKELLRGDLFVDDIASCSLVDLMSIARKDWGFQQALKARRLSHRKLVDGLFNLRNDVMHPSRVIDGVGDDGLVGTMRSRVSNLALLWTICQEALESTTDLPDEIP